MLKNMLIPSGCSVLSDSPGAIDGLHVLESSGNSGFCLYSTSFQPMSFPTERSTRAQSLFEILARTTYFARMLGEVGGREQAEEEEEQSRGMAEKNASLLSWMLRRS